MHIDSKSVIIQIDRTSPDTKHCHQDTQSIHKDTMFKP
jgi:hypothetical protein